MMNLRKLMFKNKKEAAPRRLFEAISETTMFNGMLPTEIAEHLKRIIPEFHDLEVEDVLIQQASVLSYIENHQPYRSDVAYDGYGQTSSRSLLSSEHESESDDSQLALDEALARSLEELGDDFDHLHIPEQANATIMSQAQSENTTRERHTQLTPHIRQDDIDPDRMTYEELQSLGDAVGSESKGLSIDLISRLPTFKYKVGYFKKQKEMIQCVICYTEYKNGSMLTNLPCAHHYHSDCINKWLERNKSCPVCQKEVQDE